ncbi:MAG: tetratricopeptide repeat protein [Spirochaetales bacterium]|nr:tetratricopeptide repeat protein [Spirochaetales bacterium]
MKTWWRAAVVLCCCSLCCPMGVFAQDAASPEEQSEPVGRLFVHTSPMGAEVSVNGAVQAGRTPMLLELPPGRYRLELTKEGYERVRERVEVEAGQNTVVRQALAGNLVAAAFPTEGEILLEGQAVPAGRTVFGLSPGTYELRSRGQTLSVKRQSPQDRWIDALHIVFPLFLGFAVYLTVDEALDPSAATPPFSPAVIATYGVTAALIEVDIGLNLAKRRFERSLSFQTLPPPLETVSSQALYQEVEDSFAAGRLEETLAACERLSAGAPESPYLPFALYRRAQVVGLRGDPAAAAAALEALLREYPVPDLYDRCLLGLAELRLAAGEYAAALEHLRSLPFVDPHVIKPDAMVLAGEIASRAADADPDSAAAAVEYQQELAGVE